MDKMCLLKSYKKDEVDFIYGSREIADNDTLETVGFTTEGTVYVCHR